MEHTIPKGKLPRDDRAQACWYYYIYAQKNKENSKPVEDQIVLEGFDWYSKQYIELMRHTAFLYGIENPDEITKFWPQVIAEIERWNQGRGEAQGLPKPAKEYMYVDPLNKNYGENDSKKWEGIEI